MKAFSDLKIVTANICLSLRRNKVETRLYSKRTSHKYKLYVPVYGLV